MSFGNYENIEMTAEVEDGESVSEVLKSLEQQIGLEVEKRGSATLMLDQALAQREQLTKQIDEQKRELEWLTNKISDFRKFCEDHNLNTESFDDLPF